MPTSILPPSNGWTGTRLKIANDTFNIINGTAKIAKTGFNLAMTETISATNKFDAGPAKDITAESLRGFFRLYESNSTGFAHPNGITGAPKALMTDKTNSIVVPTGS